LPEPKRSKKLAELQDSIVAAHVGRADTLRRRGGTGDASKADKVMQHLIEVNNDNYLAHLARALYFERQHDLAEDNMKQAAESIRQAYKLAPDKAETIMSMARVALRDKDFDKAREFLRKGKELFPKEVEMYLLLSHVELAAKRSAEAEHVIQEGL